MIDVEWLRSVRFESQTGTVTGLAGIGSQFIVFHSTSNAEHTELGDDVVLKIMNTPRLGFHIREIPPELELRPTYDPERVCRKLAAQVGNDLYDSMVGPYNDLYEYVVAVLFDAGLDGVASMVDDDSSAAAFTGLLGSPGLRRRIEDVAYIDADGHPDEVVSWNGLVHEIEESRAATASWARSMLRKLDGLAGLDGLPPGVLSENPYWIWGGAVLEGFFTGSEVADVVRYIETRFGDPAASPRWPRTKFEMFMFLSLLSLVAEHGQLRRMTEFCNLAGFGFVLPEPEPEPEPGAAKEPAAGEPEPGEPVGTMPKLSPPHTVSPFPEEGRADPWAQDPGLLAAAAATCTSFVDHLAASAHAVGVAVTLPPAGDDAAHRKPWRSVVPLREPLPGDRPGNEAASTADPPELGLLQRIFTGAQAVEMRSGGAVSDGLAELVEEIGYVAVGRSHDVQDRPQLRAIHALGAMAASLHRTGFIHGDLQPQNFLFTEDGDLSSMFDLGRTASPGRPLTVLERASDLAVLKKHVSFLAWEAAKLGYRSGAPDADVVLALLGAPDA